MRTVVHEQRAAEVIDAACKRYDGLDEVYRALEWRLCRKPDSGGMKLPATDPPTYLIRADPWRDAPSLALLYRFTDEKVFILSARLIPSVPAEEDANEAAAS